MAHRFPPTDFALIFCAVKNPLSKVNNRWGKFKLPCKKLIVHIKLLGFFIPKILTAHPEKSPS